jgi:hypothetical protein
MGLYQMFTRDDAGTVAMRSAVYQMWHQAAECRRTMRLLAGEETDLMQFNRAFLKVMTLAVWQILRNRVHCCRPLETGLALRSFGEWLSWFVAGNLPHLLRARS